MNKKIQVWLPLLFSITMIAGMYMGYKMRDNMPGRGFFSRDKRRPVQEVLDLINLLRLLDNPLQDIPLAAVLRSPLFGFSPDATSRRKSTASRSRSFRSAVRQVMRSVAVRTNASS